MGWTTLCCAPHQFLGVVPSLSHTSNAHARLHSPLFCGKRRPPVVEPTSVPAHDAQRPLPGLPPVHLDSVYPSTVRSRSRPSASMWPSGTGPRSRKACVHGRSSSVPQSSPWEPGGVGPGGSVGSRVPVCVPGLFALHKPPKEFCRYQGDVPKGRPPAFAGSPLALHLTSWAVTGACVVVAVAHAAAVAGAPFAATRRRP